MHYINYANATKLVLLDGMTRDILREVELEMFLVMMFTLVANEVMPYGGIQAKICFKSPDEIVLSWIRTSDFFQSCSYIQTAACTS